MLAASLLFSDSFLCPYWCITAWGRFVMWAGVCVGGGGAGGVFNLFLAEGTLL